MALVPAAGAGDGAKKKVPAVYGLKAKERKVYADAKTAAEYRSWAAVDAAREADFGDVAYWERRYEKERDKGMDFHHEWYAPVDAVLWNLLPLLVDYKRPRILMLGCGNSDLSASLYDEGYVDITNVDFSMVVIECMREKNLDKEGMRYLCVDAMDMACFRRDCFDVVIDKGMMDCVYSRVNAMEVAKCVGREIYRVLRSGGLFVSYTTTNPLSRKEHWLHLGEKIDWAIDTSFLHDEVGTARLTARSRKGPPTPPRSHTSYETDTDEDEAAIEKAVAKRLAKSKLKSKPKGSADPGVKKK